MSLKHKLLVVLLIPVVIGSSIGLMILSYLLVPVTIVLVIGSMIYAIFKMKAMN